jgi:hypothetical protein
MSNFCCLPGRAVRSGNVVRLPTRSGAGTLKRTGNSSALQQPVRDLTISMIPGGPRLSAADRERLNLLPHPLSRFSVAPPRASNDPPPCHMCGGTGRKRRPVLRFRKDDDRQTHSPERLTKLLRCQRYRGDTQHIGSLPLPLRDPLLLRRTQLLKVARRAERSEAPALSVARQWAGRSLRGQQQRRS